MGLGMKKTTKYIIITSVALVFAYYSFGTFLLVNADIQDLVRYSYNRDSGGLPLYPKKIPEFYLIKFRGNKEDLSSLKAGKGLGYILAISKDGETEKTIKYLQFFIDKGFDINSLDGDGFTVLHKAVLYNKPKAVAFLLDKKADPHLEIDTSNQSESVGMKSIDSLDVLKYAIYLQRERDQDRNTIIAMLTK